MIAGALDASDPSPASPTLHAAARIEVAFDCAATSSCNAPAAGCAAEEKPAPTSVAECEPHFELGLRPAAAQ